MIRILMGGSPCTHWSIAQKNNRETEPSGLGWELFLNYKIALDKYKPDYFLYENNKSASEAIKAEISKQLNVTEPDMLQDDNGVRMTHINSALVSAQNRQRFYVTNFGDIEQPKDRGILLKDVLDGTTDRDKGRTLLSSIGRTTTREYFKKNQNTMSFEPVKQLSDREMDYMVRSTNGKYSDRWAYLQKPGEKIRRLALPLILVKVSHIMFAQYQFA